MSFPLHQVQQAVDFSNFGVGNMKDGNFLSAIQNFSTAFQLLNPLLKESSRAAATIARTPSQKRHRSRSGGLCNQSEISQFSFLNKDGDWNLLMDRTKGKGRMIFGNGIKMPPSKFLVAASTMRFDDWHNMNVLMTSIALFNIAVAHHRYAIETGANGEEKDRKKVNQSLEKAAKLYESCYKLPRAAASLSLAQSEPE